jgi:hypothetical protein
MSDPVRFTAIFLNMEMRRSDGCGQKGEPGTAGTLLKQRWQLISLVS